MYVLAFNTTVESNTYMKLKSFRLCCRGEKKKVYEVEVIQIMFVSRGEKKEKEFFFCTGQILNKKYWRTSLND